MIDLTLDYIKERELLLKEIDRLREALQLIVRHPAEKTGEYKVGFREVRLVAAKALQQKESE